MDIWQGVFITTWGPIHPIILGYWFSVFVQWRTCQNLDRLRCLIRFHSELINFLVVESYLLPVDLSAVRKLLCRLFASNGRMANSFAIILVYIPYLPISASLLHLLLLNKLLAGWDSLDTGFCLLLLFFVRYIIHSRRRIRSLWTLGHILSH